MLLSSQKALEYVNLFKTMIIAKDKIQIIDNTITDILKNKIRYQNVANQSKNIPWFVVGIIHLLEGSLNFKTHLYNGDPLTHKTVRFPPGKPSFPPKNGVEYTWEESAIESLKEIKTEMTCLSKILFVLESYNGFGYRSKKINSPYLWSFSNQYIKGKFVEILGKNNQYYSKFDANKVSKQIGAAVILKRMVELNQIAILNDNM